ncbi:MAG: hypothetical protein HY235_25740 [Acidobacteria bacterium]|nr:hypothetical protein [Acidobacteriota bacterium]
MAISSLIRSTLLAACILLPAGSLQAHDRHSAKHYARHYRKHCHRGGGYYTHGSYYRYDPRAPVYRYPAVVYEPVLRLRASGLYSAPGCVVFSTRYTRME